MRPSRLVIRMIAGVLTVALATVLQESAAAPLARSQALALSVRDLTGSTRCGP